MSKVGTPPPHNQDKPHGIMASIKSNRLPTCHIFSQRDQSRNKKSLPDKNVARVNRRVIKSITYQILFYIEFQLILIFLTFSLQGLMNNNKCKPIYKWFQVYLQCFIDHLYTANIDRFFSYVYIYSFILLLIINIRQYLFDHLQNISEVITCFYRSFIANILYQLIYLYLNFLLCDLVDHVYLKSLPTYLQMISNISTRFHGAFIDTIQCQVLVCD